MQLRPLSVDELPAYSPWPARLLGVGGADAPEWGGTGVEAYEDAHEQYLDLHRDHPEWDAEDLKRAALHHAREAPAPLSRGGDLYLGGPDEVGDLQNETLLDAVDPVLDGGETVVALGCGWGHELHVLAEAYPDCVFVGAEVTAAGRELAERLVGDCADIEPFDFRDDRWPVLERDGPVVVFSRGSFSALPDATDAVETLGQHTVDVAAGVHLEHVHAMHPTDTLLGLLRRAYTLERGYDQAFLPALESVREIEVTGTEYDRVGGNPLHPVSLVRWRPAEGTA